MAIGFYISQIILAFWLVLIYDLLDDRRIDDDVVRTLVTHSPNGSRATFLFLPQFDVICDLLVNRRTATWNLFVHELCGQAYRTQHSQQTMYSNVCVRKLRYVQNCLGYTLYFLVLQMETINLEKRYLAISNNATSSRYLSLYPFIVTCQ